MIGFGDHGPDVDIVRRKLGLPPGKFDRSAWQRVAGIARERGLPETGEVTEAIASVLGESEAARAGLTPQWFRRELHRGDFGPDVSAVRTLMGLDDGPFDHTLEAAVRRYESGAGLQITGKVGIAVARLMGELAEE